MAVSKMKLVRTVGRVQYLNQFIAACCVGGFYQPEQAMKHLSGTLGFVPLNEENPHTPLLHKIEELAEDSQFTLKTKRMRGATAIDSKTYAYIQQLSKKLGDMHEERVELTNQLETCENAMEQYRHFTGLGIDLGEIFNCSYLKVRFGHMPKDSAKKLVAYADNPYVLFIPCSSDAVDDWGAYFAPRERADEVDRIFASLYFERLRIPGAVGKPEEIVEELEKNTAIIRKEIEELDARNAEFWNKEAERCCNVYSRLSFLAAVFDLRRFAAVHGDSFFYVGWIPEDSIKDFEKGAKGVDGISYEVDNPEATEGHEPPVKLKNWRIFRPFEYIVSMFGMPSPGDVDVTVFVALTYTAMFGIMFGDVGQGVVLGLAGLFMWKKMKMAMGKILTYCGVSAVAGGFLYGSFFGFEHVMDPLYKAVGLPHAPVPVMESINGLLLFSIGIGIFLLVFSMGINIFAKLRQKNIGEALFSHNGLCGIIFYLCGVNAAYGMMTKTQLIPSGIAMPLLGVTALALFFQHILIQLVNGEKDWKPESWGDFILENFFEVFEYVLSYFSNTLSFLRVGAFALVHAGMMMAVFSLTKENNIIVIILGNLFVMGLEALFTSIQLMRLEFYEMFSRFYTGEGREFEPVNLK